MASVHDFSHTPFGESPAATSDCDAFSDVHHILQRDREAYMNDIDGHDKEQAAHRRRSR